MTRRFADSASWPVRGAVSGRIPLACLMPLLWLAGGDGAAGIGPQQPTVAVGEEETMVRNALMPFARNGLGIEPAIDRFLGRSLDMPVWAEGTEIRELEDRAEIQLDVPGAKPDQVAVSVENRTLTVKVTREGRGEFTRQFAVGPTYDLGRIDAHLELGVLTLVLPKAAEAQPRTIEVKAR